MLSDANPGNYVCRPTRMADAMIEDTCFILDDLLPYDLTRENAEYLVDLDLLAQNEECSVQYDLTAYVWDDLGLHGEPAYKLLDLVLRVREG